MIHDNILIEVTHLKCFERIASNGGAKPGRRQLKSDKFV